MRIVVLFSLLFSSPLFGANPSPLGLEIGVATLKDAKQSLGSKMPLKEMGKNRYSHGPMLEGPGEKTEIQNLNNFTLIFDEQEKLNAVVMNFPKNELKPILASLKKKYKIQREQVPFVGNASARLTAADTVIDVDAPHLSFNMQVLYMSNKFLKMATNQSAAEDQAAKKKTENQL
jgi:hypothetical protein